MKTIVLCGITLLAVAPAFAQTGSPATADSANSTVTLTGCVGSRADASGFILGNAMVIPGTAQPGQTDRTPSPLPPTTAPATQPTTIAPAAPASTPPPPSTAASPAQVPPPASAAQIPPRASVAQTGATTATAGTVGTAGTTPASVTGTTGVVAGGAAPNTTAGLGGYRLSGADMKPWAGQRVQVVGTFSPSAATTAGATATGQAGAPAAPPLGFKVLSVQPMSGPCPK